MKFEELEENEFEEFFKNHELSTFLQSPHFSKADELEGWKVIYLGIKNNNKIIAACRLKYIAPHFNKKVFYAPRGILMNYNDEKVVKFFTDNIKKYIKKRGGYVLHIDPAIIYKERDINGNIVKDGIDNSKVIDMLKKLGFKHDGFTRCYDYTKQVRWSFELPLKNKTEEDILKEMNGNTRRAIQKAEHFGVKIRELGKEELNIFKNIMESTSERREFKDKSLEHYETMYDAFHDSGETKFLLAYVDLKETIKILNKDLFNLVKEKSNAEAHKKISKLKEINSQIDTMEKRIEEIEKIKKEKGNTIYLASAMFMIFKRDILYYHSGSYKEYMNFFGQYLIQWEMIKEAIRMQKECYNFYGIKGVFDKNDEDYGVYLFKKGFNGHVVEYIGDFYLPITPYYYIQKFISSLKNRKIKK